MILSKKNISFTGGIAVPTLLLFVALVISYAVLWNVYAAAKLSHWYVLILGAILAYGMFTVVHEACHGNISGGNNRLKFLETIIGWIASTTLFFPYSAFVVIHLNHHAHTNNPEKDPDSYVNGSSVSSTIMRCFTLIGHYYKISFTPKNSMEAAMIGTRKYSLLFIVCILIISSILIANGLGAIFFFVFVGPALIAAPFLGFTFDWLPHYPHRNMGKYHNTRIVRVPGLEFLSFFQNYHHIHHLYPRIPFYNYRMKFKAIESELRKKNTPIEGVSFKDAKILSAKNTYNDIISGGTWHYLLEVETINQLTKDAIEVVFKKVANLPFRFKAGQYVVLTRELNNETISRCYSICSSPNSGTLKIGIKRVLNGKLSNALLDQLTVGSMVNVKGPFGTFNLRETIGNQKSYKISQHIFIAGGSGITPILSMLEKALEDGLSSLSLIYGCRSNQDVMFKERLEKLSQRYSSQFKLQIVYEVLTTNYQIDLLKEKVSNACYYICGPAPMMQASKDALKHNGVCDSHIFYEEFKVNAAVLGGKQYNIQTNNNLFISYETETILEASIRQQQPLIHACGMGQCGTCKVKLITGEVVWKQQPQTALLENEKEEGYILSCMCMPKSDLSIIRK
ncbi:fatty acid desaturase [Aquimarina sp. 2-A2]|uniref:fatty acid desaturase n=1 Tax=Aquimarina sp. 2-A2 TaxID=3382644 RepID=UPI00387F0A4A